MTLQVPLAIFVWSPVRFGATVNKIVYFCAFLLYTVSGSQNANLCTDRAYEDSLAVRSVGPLTLVWLHLYTPLSKLS